MLVNQKACCRVIYTIEPHCYTNKMCHVLEDRRGMERYTLTGHLAGQAEAGRDSLHFLVTIQSCLMLYNKCILL